MSDTYHVKARKHGDKVYRFVGTGGRLTRLRVHALQFTKDGADQFVAEGRHLDPDYEFTVRHA